MKIKTLTAGLIILMGLSCERQQVRSISHPQDETMNKIVIYQVFTRLFGNTNSHNKPWGTLDQNGVGKFRDFSDKALTELKDLGVSHIWFTGVLHHATVTDYSPYGLPADDPDVVKGRAGSPYAIKDYYQVNPDLAIDPNKRLEEFEQLIERSHRNGLKVIIDMVPNHVARNYKSVNKPAGVLDLGEQDDTSVAYKKDNNFYYIPGEVFRVPNWENDYRPLGGEEHPGVDHVFDEDPAKWTGNGSRASQPNMHDWYETVKINYGISPEGHKDFDELPSDLDLKDLTAINEFWEQRDIPDSWLKMKQIAAFWIAKGVDGFRFDMAEMVPVEFWSYMNSWIKSNHPDVLLLAEVYNPTLYRDYIHKGKMDYLYDKVGFYDTIRNIIEGHGRVDHIPQLQRDVQGIEDHMLHFLENHDEQRIASEDFAADPRHALPGMVVSVTISKSPTLIYFGQEVGEPGNENAGFGQPTRTSIFDYIGVPHHQRWMNHGQFDGGMLSEEERSLRNYYKKLLNLSLNSSALMGHYMEIHTYNRDKNPNYSSNVYSFARWSEEERLLILANFDKEHLYDAEILLPDELINTWQLNEDSKVKVDHLSEASTASIIVKEGKFYLKTHLQPLQSAILSIE